MGVEEVTTVQISCDNPNCPGHELDTTDRTGWLFTSAEVYGQPTQSNVFCSPTCASEYAAAVATQQALAAVPPPPAP